MYIYKLMDILSDAIVPYNQKMDLINLYIRQTNLFFDRNKQYIFINAPYSDIYVKHNQITQLYHHTLNNNINLFEIKEKDIFVWYDFKDKLPYQYSEYIKRPYYNIDEEYEFADQLMSYTRFTQLQAIKIYHNNKLDKHNYVFHINLYHFYMEFNIDLAKVVFNNILCDDDNNAFETFTIIPIQGDKKNYVADDFLKLAATDVNIQLFRNNYVIYVIDGTMKTNLLKFLYDIHVSYLQYKFYNILIVNAMTEENISKYFENFLHVVNAPGEKYSNTTYGNWHGMINVFTCAKNRLYQFTDTCWLNTTLNVIMLSSHLSKIAEDCYNKYHTKHGYIIDDIQSMCPILGNADFIEKYIFAFIQRFIVEKRGLYNKNSSVVKDYNADSSTNIHENDVIVNLAKAIKTEYPRRIEDNTILYDPYLSFVNVFKAISHNDGSAIHFRSEHVHFCFQEIYNFHFDGIDVLICKSTCSEAHPYIDIGGKKYLLEAAGVALNHSTEPTGHVISGLFCREVPYVYDSNGILVKCDWPNGDLKEYYKALEHTGSSYVDYTNNSLYVIIYVYTGDRTISRIGGRKKKGKKH